MLGTRHLAVITLFAMAAPAAAAEARDQWGSAARVAPAYNEGYTRGVRAGDEDSRRRESFNFTDESDYRRGDAGYRREYGSVDRYRDDFRRGFADGYRAGYGRNGQPGYPGSPTDRYPTDPRNDGRVGPPPWSNGRGNAPWDGRDARGDQWRNPGFQNGVNDGYEAGLKDARARRRYDPISEGRYRGADHGYERRYGSKDAYKIDYRQGFKLGYDEGYRDGVRYSDRRDDRGRYLSRPWWWPFS